MSTETSEFNQPSDGDESGGRHWRLGFLHADTGVDSGTDARDADTQNAAFDADDVAADDVASDDVDTENGVTTGTVYDNAVDRGTQRDEAEPRATFTPSPNGPTGAAFPSDDGQVVQGQVIADDDGLPGATRLDGAPVDDRTTVPVGGTAAGVPATEATPTMAATSGAAAMVGGAAPAPAVTPNAPLLGDAVGLRASWQQAAAEFVDDPRAAVADAAELVEHTAQTLIGALQQRQRQLRGQWENGTPAGATGSSTATGAASDTEELRHLMQSYRALFNQLVHS